MKEQNQIQYLEGIRPLKSATFPAELSSLTLFLSLTVPIPIDTSNP